MLLLISKIHKTGCLMLTAGHHYQDGNTVVNTNFYLNLSTLQL